MHSDPAEVLARFRTCRDAGIPIPGDLAVAVEQVLVGQLTGVERKARRDRGIRLAALLLPANDEPWAKAGHLLEEARLIARGSKATRSASVRDQLLVAAMFKPLPDSQRQFFRIIECAGNDD